MIDAQEVNNLTVYCMPEDGEFTEEMQAKYEEGQDVFEGFVIVPDALEGTFVFNSERIEEKKSEIRAMLEQLPEVFSEGMSLMNAVVDKDENLWGEQRDAGRLMALGMATGDVISALPRMLWQALPGSMPYYIVKIKEEA